MKSIPVKSIRASIERMRERYKHQQKENNIPTATCIKCKSTYWEQTEDDDWYCFICGNRGWWQDGEFIQHAAINTTELDYNKDYNEESGDYIEDESEGDDNCGLTDEELERILSGDFVIYTNGSI